MNTPLKPTEKFTLQAFLLALTELDFPVPEDIQQEIHQIGDRLARKDHRVIEQIPKLIKKYEPLNELYQKAHFNLQQDYQTQERDKAVAYSSGEIALDDVAASLFQAGDYKQMAEQILKPFKKTSDYFINLWKTTLSQAQAQNNILAISILKEIESVPFTKEDLTYKFNVPKEKTLALIQQLWDEGKIDTLNGGIIGTIFPQLRKKKEPHLKDPLTLTSWGFFYLHPIFSIKN